MRRGQKRPPEPMESWESPGWDPEHWRMLYQRWGQRSAWDADLPPVEHWCEYWRSKMDV
jgi:hypothetical protein